MDAGIGLGIRPRKGNVRGPGGSRLRRLVVEKAATRCMVAAREAKATGRRDWRAIEAIVDLMMWLGFIRDEGKKKKN